MNNVPLRKLTLTVIRISHSQSFLNGYVISIYIDDVKSGQNIALNTDRYGHSQYLIVVRQTLVRFLRLSFYLVSHFLCLSFIFPSNGLLSLVHPTHFLCIAMSCFVLTWNDDQPDSLQFPRSLVLSYHYSQLKQSHQFNPSSPSDINSSDGSRQVALQ